MGKIALSSALGEFTQRVISALKERKNPTTGFKAFFGEVVSGAREVSWEIKRRNRPVAVDIAPHEHGTTTKSTKSSQKVYRPPFYDLNTNVDALDSFERVFNTSQYVDVPNYRKLVEETAQDMQDNMDRIERAEELQRSQALLTGVVTLNNGDDITFGRKAASLLAYDNSFGWDVATNNPGKILKQGAEFMVTEGNADAKGVINVVLGSESIDEFRGNPIRQKEGDIKDQMYMDLSVGAQAVSGLTPQGAYSYGNYRFNLWGYEGYYDIEGGTSNLRYMDSKSIIMLPSNIDFKMFYGGTKAWRGTGENRFPTVIKGKRNFYRVYDELNVSMLLGVRTSPVALLRSLDNVFTAAVVGTAQQG